MAVSQFSRSTSSSLNPRLSTLANISSLPDPFWSRVALLLQDGDISNQAPNGIGIEQYVGTGNGLVNTSTVLSGSTKSIAIGNQNKILRYMSNALWNDFSQGFTYEFYVNWSSFGDPYLISRWNNNGGGLYQTNVTSPNGSAVTWSFRRDGTTSDLFNLTIPMTFSTNQWYHIALVLDGTASSGTARIYVNGSQTNTFTYSQTLMQGSQTDMSLGFKQDGGAPAGYYNGLAYFDRVRFTAAVRYPSGTSFTPPSQLLPTRGA